uniref:Uncharacterized protein n=1 Tax=Megaselia scalaris TaxID=36166 RepID=T1GRV7_MEGSC
MINDSFQFSSDDESECHPHDLEGGGSDLEYGYPEMNGLSHLNSGPHPFNQSQGNFDRQRLLGDRPRTGVYESIMENGLEAIEHQERYVN